MGTDGRSHHRMTLSVPAMIWKFAAEFGTTRVEVTTTIQETATQSLTRAPLPPSDLGRVRPERGDGRMRGSSLAEEQIVAMLREQEGGAPTAETRHKHGVGSATFYGWKSTCGGMDVSDARRLKALEDENAKLKKLLAEQMLDNAMLRDVTAKKW